MPPYRLQGTDAPLSIGLADAANGKSLSMAQSQPTKLLRTRPFATENLNPEFVTKAARQAKQPDGN